MSKTHIWQPASFQKRIRWRPENGEGLEHLNIHAEPDEIVIDSVVAGDRFSVPYGVRYRIRCASDWSVRYVRVDVTGGETLELLSDGQGNWTGAGGVSLPGLSGCIDVDISATPFTNTLPIRRLAPAQNERRLIKVVYISVPTLEVSAAEQAYTCLEAGRLYRYEGLFRNFTADLEIDSNGIVLDYPGLFKRIRTD